MCSLVFVQSAQAASWTTNGPLTIGREFHTATLLLNGRILVVGGFSNAIPEQYASSAELYDPATGMWTISGSLHIPRAYHTATLLPNGRVLVTGGSNGSSLSSAEVYDTGLGYSPSSQPQIAAVIAPLSLGGCLALTGSGFLGLSGGSDGNSQDSPADYPLAELRSLESGQTLFLPCANWQTNSLISAPVLGFPPGYALATVIVNGGPSTGSVVNVSVPVPTATTLTDTKQLTNGACQFWFTNTVGALFGVLAATNPALPLSDWTALGGVTEVVPGQFQFIDPQATNTACRFYRLRAP